MSRKLGNDYHLWVESATPGTYNRVKGQGNLSVTRNGNVIDVSAKEDFPYAAQAPGMRTTNIAVELIPDLPDANGYTRMETLSNATSPTPFNIQIRKGGTAGTGSDVVFQCSVYCTDFPTNFGQNEGAKVNFTLVGAAAPTTDVLA